MKVQKQEIPASIFTIDLEEWFCTHDEPEIGGFEGWAGHEERAYKVVPGILKMLDDAGVKATFFVLGWLAERRLARPPPTVALDPDALA